MSGAKRYSDKQQHILTVLFDNHRKSIRMQIARSLNIPTTEHGFEDVSFAMEAMKLQERPECFGEVDLKQLREFTRMSQEELTKLMKKFIKFDSDHSGDINYNEFREALGLPDSEYVERLFNLLDVDESGSISWKKYISGIALLSEEVKNEEAIKLAFKLFDQDGDGHIDERELFTILNNVIPTISNEEVSQIFKNVDLNHDGIIDYRISFLLFPSYPMSQLISGWHVACSTEEFVQFLQENPEFMQLISFRLNEGQSDALPDEEGCLQKKDA
jgi:Ca2+-binding EF-hand superfamily protein